MILNRQRSIRVSVAQFNQFASRARKLLKLPMDALAICLVSEAEIARWNRAYRGKNAPTDVLSFPNSHPPRQSRNGKSHMPKAPSRNRSRRAVSLSGKSDSTYLGDIAIAPAVARKNAVRFGRTFEDEMRILILHGMLHLMGYDHETDNGQMERREKRLRRALGLS